MLVSKLTTSGDPTWVVLPTSIHSTTTAFSIHNIAESCRENTKEKSNIKKFHDISLLHTNLILLSSTTDISNWEKPLRVFSITWNLKNELLEEIPFWESSFSASQALAFQGCELQNLLILGPRTDGCQGKETPCSCFKVQVHLGPTVTAVMLMCFFQTVTVTYN